MTTHNYDTLIIICKNWYKTIAYKTKVTFFVKEFEKQDRHGVSMDLDQKFKLLIDKKMYNLLIFFVEKNDSINIASFDTLIKISSHWQKFDQFE